MWKTKRIRSAFVHSHQFLSHLFCTFRCSRYPLCRGNMCPTKSKGDTPHDQRKDEEEPRNPVQLPHQHQLPLRHLRRFQLGRMPLGLGGYLPRTGEHAGRGQGQPEENRGQEKKMRVAALFFLYIYYSFYSLAKQPVLVA